MRIQRALVWALLACGPLAAQRFTLSGVVVDGMTNRPMAAVEVHLQTERWEAVGDSVTTDAQGRFAFTGLEPAEYILSAEVPGLGTINFAEAPDPGWVSTVRVGGERGDKSVTFRILPRGTIEGVIRDEFGDPMMGADVSLVRPLWRDGRTVTANISQKATDDRGRYRFGNLAPGNYMVCAAGAHNAVAPVEGPVNYAVRIENRSYMRICGRSFQLSPGQRAQTDLSPLVGTSATVSGRVQNIPPQTGFSIFLQAEEGGISPNSGSFVDPTHPTFAIHDVLPGHYILRANIGSGEKPLSAELPVDVGGADVGGLDVVLEPGGVIELAIHGVAENHLDIKRFSASLHSADGRADSRGAQTDEEGQMRFETLPAGRYRLTFRTPEGSCVESVKLEDRDVRGAAFELGAAAKAHLDVTVTKHCGSIRARAVRDGSAVPYAKVVLLLDGTPQAPGDMLEDFADDDGEYSFEGLAPGHYMVWAWAAGGEGATVGPRNLAAVEKQATAVDVKEGAPTQVDVPLLQNEGTNR